MRTTLHAGKASESVVPMNANENAVHAGECGAFPLHETRPERAGEVRVEPCEFEKLLQRAMEILDTRARAATASCK